MVFHWSLNDSNFLQVSRTLLSILVDLNNAVVWMVSTRPVISKFSSPSINPLVTVPRAPNTITTLMFHIFFKFPSKVELLILLFTFFQFYSGVSRDREIYNFESSLFLLIWLKLRDPFLCQNPKGVCVSHFLGQMLGCAYIICSYGQI